MCVFDRLGYMRAVTAVVAIVGILVASGCGGNSVAHVSAKEAISAATSTAAPGIDSSVFGLFPKTPLVVSCAPQSGGPLGTVHPVPGKCATRVKFARNGSATVEFKVAWDSHHYADARYPAGKQAHTWDFLVSPRGSASFVREYGAAPPWSYP